MTRIATVRRFGGVRTLGIAAIVVLASACGQPDSPSTSVISRLIANGDYLPSSAAVFYETEEVRRWEFVTDHDLSEWTLERIDVNFGVDKDGLFIESTSTDPSISRSVELDAETIKAIRVTQTGLTSDAYLQLYWAAESESFSEARTVGCATKDATGALIPSYTFRVRDHQQWRGDIRSIRLDPTSVANRRQQIHSISAVNFLPSEQRLATVSRLPWRVDIQGDARTAMLAPPGHSIDRELEVPANSSLRFAHGLEAGVTHPVIFRIRLDEDESNNTIIYEEVVDPCDSADGCGWVESEIDLSGWKGRKILLRFETEAPTQLDFLDGFPAWAGLEIVQPASRTPPPNVVLVVLDTLRADHMSLNGYQRPTSPNLDAWARDRAVIFDTVVAPAPWTLPSHVSIFTGLDTLSHGVNTGDPMPESLESMAEIMRTNGYTTHAITGGAYLSDTYGVMQGFDSYLYYHRPVIDPSEVANDLVEGIDHAIRWIENNTDRPFFLLFHTYEIHTPYRAREPFYSEFHKPQPGEPIPPIDTLPIAPVRETGYLMTAALKARFDGEDLPYEMVPPEFFPMVNALYDSGIAYADLHLKRLFDRIDDLRLNRDTVVVVTSDHGESLGEKGKVDHKSLEDCELLVPLMIAAPDKANLAGRRVKTQVRLIDVLPTVLELIGLEPPADIDGSSLVPLIDDPSSAHPEDAWSYASSSNFGLALRRASRVKYTFNNSSWIPTHGLESLYRLDADPTTSNDVAATDPETNRFREETTTAFDRRTSGVRVSFSNRLEVPMEGHIKGHIVQPMRVKALRLSTTDIEWRYQMVNFTVPAGETVVFFIEGIPFGEFYITGRFDVQSETRTGFKKVLRLEQMTEPWRTAFDGNGWDSTLAADPEEALSTVDVRIHGERAGTGAPASIDEQNLALLKKLGYIH